MRRRSSFGITTWRGAELHLLECVDQVALVDGVLGATRGQQGRVVDEIGEVGASHARGG
jgi:hypothetical protein